MSDASDPGATAPPAEAAPAAPAPQAPPASEGVTNSGKQDEQQIPFSRFQEVNDKAKAADERNATLEAELEQLRNQQSQASSQDDDIEPETLDLISKSAKKLGFVSKEELDAREAQLQVRQDITDLTNQYKDSGIAFDGKKIIDYARANGIQITSRKSLDAVYKEMNYETIIEAQRKAAIDAFQQGDKSGGEKGGSQGATKPEESKPTNLKDRIKAAREKANFNVT